MPLHLGQQARIEIDRLLTAAGWRVCGVKEVDLHAARGVVVLMYYEAYLNGLTASPNKQTFGFFNQNLVMQYGRPQAVADGVNVKYDVYRIRTLVTEAGSRVAVGY